MLYIFLFVMVGIQADSASEKYTQSAESITARINSYLYNCGGAIKNINVPLVGRLGAILPFAVISFCLQKFPGQTLLLAGSALMYTMYRNDNMLNFFRTYNVIERAKVKKTMSEQSKEVVLEDDFFVFDGEDYLDAEEEEELEDELLKRVKANNNQRE